MIDKIQQNAIAILSMLILGALVSLLAIRVAPIDVLRNWVVTVNPIDYRAGDTLQIKSTSVKLRKADGHAMRSLSCTNGSNTTTYPLNESAAKRSPGIRNSDLEIVVPSTITYLPAKCRIVTNVTYRVYLIRTVTEHNESNQFTVVQ